MIASIIRNEPTVKQERTPPDGWATVIQFYDDGPAWPCSPEREQAFRQGFVEEARRIVRDWVDPNADTDPFDEEEAAIRRGSQAEPTTDGKWTADLSPVGGPVLGPFPCRSQALDAERIWLEDHWLNL